LSISPAFAADSGIKIGVLNDQSGVYADLGGKGSVEAAKMAVEDFGGKVLGKPIEVIFADHQNKPDVGSAIARKWFDEDGVDVIVDVPNSGVALAVQDVAKSKGKIDMLSGPATAALTGAACSPTGIMWTYNTYALAHGTGSAMVAEGGKTWYFITADYAFGTQLEKDTAEVVTAMGGKVMGDAKAPLSTPDFSSFLLQAQGSGAQVVGLANAGGDTVNSIKQAHEFGLTKSGQKLAGLLVFITDVNSLGLDTAQGLVLTTGFYWDMDDQTRAWSKKFAARMGGKEPTQVQAGVYSEVLHYLKGVQAANSREGTAVVAKMRELPIDDFFAKHGKLREDGQMVHDMYLAQVKTPAESKGPWDYYKILRTIPADQAYIPLDKSACPLLKK
jgi:branched-chain amino acid transport system substrate-binding protein